MTKKDILDKLQKIAGTVIMLISIALTVSIVLRDQSLAIII